MNLDILKEKLSVFLNDLGYDLYDLIYKKKKTRSILTVYIDKPEGITIDDCVTVTNEINPYIDELDPIKEEYFLEVSSAGAEKELRTELSIKNSIGKFCHVETEDSKFEGYLESFDDGVLLLKVGKSKLRIEYEKVNLIRLAVKF